MAFDPNAATARYIDSLGPATLQKAHDYTVGKEWMLLWALVVAAVVTWLIVRWGGLDRLEVKIGEKRRNLGAFVVALVYFLLSTALTAPWTIYADWWREKSYGRTKPAVCRLARPGRAQRRDHLGRRGDLLRRRLLADPPDGKALVDLVGRTNRARARVRHAAEPDPHRAAVQQI
jgi:hypothetical protein